MRVGVGYCDTPDSTAAGRQAVAEAIKQAGRSDPCDMVLLFATARHDAQALRKTIAALVGPSVPIIGGGAVGAISNTAFGYAGDQVILALFWLDDVQCRLFAESDIHNGETEAGRRLGKQLAEAGITEDAPLLLFYDAIDRTKGDLRLVTATGLLAGMEDAVGFLPRIAGAGFQGNYVNTPYPQWTGNGISAHNALALTFSDNIQMDGVIMHGCRPATGYYTVTKTDGQTILEINNRPALSFINNILGHAVPQEAYPFFLILGVNRGNKWDEFDEARYASRLCLGIAPERNGIIMFEPDMVPGTEFQIMYRSLELGYMAPKMDELFERTRNRKPVFALYINCAGRAAGYAGIDLEDALVVQKTLGNRAPLLGIYSGVEIAPVEGKPRGLDWTGVFCLFSVPA